MASSPHTPAVGDRDRTAGVARERTCPAATDIFCFELIE